MSEFTNENESICDSEGENASRLIQAAREKAGAGASPMMVWQALQSSIGADKPISLHELCYNLCYEGVEDIRPTWVPSKEQIGASNIQKMMNKKGFKTYQEFYDWSVGIDTQDNFWMESMEACGIEWENAPSRAFDLSNGGAAHASYFPDGTLNIADSCFNKRESHEPALVYAMESDPRELQTMSFAVLERLSNQIANAIHTKLGLHPGDAVGICMPMTPESIAIYLGIVKSGCSVISIADSFSAPEIAMRCRLGKAKSIITQDVIYRGAKFLPLFSRVLDANDIMMREMEEQCGKGEGEGLPGDRTAPKMEPMKVVILPGMLHAGPYPKLPMMKRSPSGTWDDRDEEGNSVQVHESVKEIMRPNLDTDWHSFLHQCSDEFTSIKRGAMDVCNILFSSGTTGEPKAIVWSHSTPIKCAIDGYYHQDIQTGERVVWPTNIGWMMGPWLVYQLINGATIGIFNGITSTDAFCQYVEQAEMSMVGVIPSLVKAWQATDATKNCNWDCVRRFSSTGEASDPGTMHWLVSRVPGYAPVIEYCGGTEIGGSFMSSTVVQPNVPSMFSSPVLGSLIYVLDANDKAIEASRFSSTGDNGSLCGEIALVSPCLGLSTHLLNRNHYETYFQGMNCAPDGRVMRRHGDEIEIIRSSAHYDGYGSNTDDATTSACHPYLRALGRCDDTMNIGGIKVGSVEIERVCNLCPGVKETAAIAISGPRGGPSKLVIYTVLSSSSSSSAAAASSSSSETRSEGKAREGEDTATLRIEMQKLIKGKLNPLFTISDVVVTVLLPRTASNKVMRRVLRDSYIRIGTNK